MWIIIEAKALRIRDRAQAFHACAATAIEAPPGVVSGPWDDEHLRAVHADKDPSAAPVGLVAS